ncbi:MAG: hypothetical protein KDK28_21140, partial [Maritimibacter sp.]|nr:hypothetical protein [Maritimibacter sp.]
MARTNPTWAGWLAGGAVVAVAAIGYFVLVQPGNREAGSDDTAPPATALSPTPEAPAADAPSADAPETGTETAETETGTDTAPTLPEGTETETAQAEPAQAETAAPDPAAPETPPAETAEGTQPAAAPQAEVDGQTDPATAGAASPDGTAATPPSFDTVRIDPEGGALVAGRADPDARVTVRVDGQIVAEAEADGAGNFATLFTLPANEATRVMTLEAA